MPNVLGIRAAAFGRGVRRCRSATGLLSRSDGRGREAGGFSSFVAGTVGYLAGRVRCRPSASDAAGFFESIPLALVLVLAWLPALFPLSATAATLSGFITDAATGESLPFGSVLIKGTRLGALSNSNGFYAVRGIPAGRHTIVFSYVGYTTFEVVLSLADPEEKRLDAKLTPRPSRTAETVVEAERHREERSIQTGFISVETQKLKELPAIGETDVLRSLQLLPGIQSSSDISSGLYIRGGGPDQTLILLDQIPLYNPSHAFGFFSTFNGDAIKDMTLHKGAYPAQYGGRLGAVADAGNRDGNRNQFKSSGGVSLISGRLMLEGPVGRGSWMVAGRRTYLDPLLAALRSTTGADLPDYYFYDLNAKLNRNVGASDNLMVSGYFGRDDLDFDLDQESFFKIRWGNAAYTGKWTHLFSPSLFGNFVIARSAYTSSTSLSFFDTPIAFSNSIFDATVKGDLDYAAGAGHAISAGLLATRYNFSFKQSFNRQALVDLRLRPILAALYLQDQWQFWVDTAARLGLRSTFFSEGRRFDLEPRLSVSHVLTPELQIKVGGGTYHQYLQLITTEGFSGGDFWVPLDETVKPGRSWQATANLDWAPSMRYQMSAETYYTGLANLVQIDTKVAGDMDESTSEDVFVTGGRGHATGVEIFCERRTGAVTGWIGYTLGWTRRKFDEFNQGRSFPPKYDRRHDLSVVASYRRGRWNLGANLIYATGQAFTPAVARYSLRSPATGVLPDEDFVLPGWRNSARLLPYHRVDLKVKRECKLAGQPAEWYVQIFNVYSRRNEWFVQYDTEKPDTKPEVVKMLPIIPTIGIDFKL